MSGTGKFTKKFTFKSPKDSDEESENVSGKTNHQKAILLMNQLDKNSDKKSNSSSNNSKSNTIFQANSMILNGNTKELTPLKSNPKFKIETNKFKVEYDETNPDPRHTQFGKALHAKIMNFINSKADYKKYYDIIVERFNKNGIDPIWYACSLNTDLEWIKLFKWCHDQIRCKGNIVNKVDNKEKEKMQNLINLADFVSPIILGNIFQIFCIYKNGRDKAMAFINENIIEPEKVLPKCNFCTMQNFKNFLCETCKKVYYCDTECQIADLKKHKLVCITN